MNEFLHFSDDAMARLQALFHEAGSQMHLRLFVVGGSCKGLQYGFQFDANKREDDTVIKVAAPFVVIADPVSIQYLEGAEITYREVEGEEGRFSITNPNVMTSCQGCSGH